MEITQDEVKRLFDYKDGFLYWKVKKAQCINIGDKAGCLNNQRGILRHKIKVNNKLYFASRLIFLYHKGYMPEFVDHENNNPLDDRIDNLRDAKRFENNRNKTSAKGSTSKYLGVFFHKSTQKWIAEIRINEKKKHLGCFKNEQDAAMAYNQYADAHYGKFANLNII